MSKKMNNIEDNNATEIKTIDKLEQIIKEENIQQHYKKKCTPKKQTDSKITALIIDGTEVANFRRSGFPVFKDVVKMCQLTLKHHFNHLTVVIDESLQYLVDEDEASWVKKLINEKKLDIDGNSIQLLSFSGQENVIENMLNLADESNSRLLINDDDKVLVPLYKHKFSWLESSSSNWQIKYTIDQTEFKLII